MTEQEALARMIPPGRVRPGKMGPAGGVIQVLLTRACTLSCYSCTQGSNLGGKPTFMSLDNFRKSVESLRDYFGLTALFGGQPTLHPQFPEVCEILSEVIPMEKRGLWTNALNGHGAVCRRTFLPHNCNLNVHLSQSAYDEFRRDWPEARPFGLDKDSRHSPPFVAMSDVGVSEEKRWELISRCDINQHWSALIGEFRGEPRGYFCEIAGAQSFLHQHEPDYPDTGLRVDRLYDDGEKRWWQLPMHSFTKQVRKHCHECGVPLRGHGQLAVGSEEQAEQVSATHEAVYRTKRRRPLHVVTSVEQLGDPLARMTDYIGNSSR